MSNILEYNPNAEDHRAPDWLIDKTLDVSFKCLSFSPIP